MSISTPAPLYTQGFGTKFENVEVPVVSSINPTSAMINYPIGKHWINQLTNMVYELTSFNSAGGTFSANWITAVPATGTSAAMILGTTTVLSSAVTATSKIVLSVATPGGTQGFLSVGTIVPGVSFVINSDSALDTSTVSWVIFN